MQRWTTKHTHFKGEQGESKFDGKLIQLIGVGIGCALLIGFTLGIGTFWAHCWKQRWYTKHTIIDGQKLDFNGKGLQFLGSCIKWILLTIITFGIYSFWLVVKIEKWTVKHTFIKGAKGYKEIPPKPEGYSSALTLVILGYTGFILSPIVSLVCAIVGIKKANEIKMKGLKTAGIIGLVLNILSMVFGLISMIPMIIQMIGYIKLPPSDSEIYAGHHGDPNGYYVKLDDTEYAHYVLIDENFDGVIYISSDASVCYYYAQLDTNPNDSVIYDIFSANINGYSTNFELYRNESGNVDYFDNSNSMSFSHNIPICMCHYGSGDDTIYLPASYADAILLPDGFTGTIYNY
ncbi:MAG: DUF898 family protein [Clostridia bacterium]|nr:DUF898 family protein [Clostridia bacterium]